MGIKIIFRSRIEIRNKANIYENLSQHKSDTPALTLTLTLSDTYLEELRYNGKATKVPAGRSCLLLHLKRERGSGDRSSSHSWRDRESESEKESERERMRKRVRVRERGREGEREPS
jgi:hypothetical protein